MQICMHLKYIGLFLWVQVKSKAHFFSCYMGTDQLTPDDKSAFGGTAVPVRVCLIGACDIFKTLKLCYFLSKLEIYETLL